MLAAPQLRLQVLAPQADMVVPRALETAGRSRHPPGTDYGVQHGYPSIEPVNTVLEKKVVNSVLYAAPDTKGMQMAK